MSRSQTDRRRRHGGAQLSTELRGHLWTRRRTQKIRHPRTSTICPHTDGGTSRQAFLRTRRHRAAGSVYCSPTGSRRQSRRSPLRRPTTDVRTPRRALRSTRPPCSPPLRQPRSCRQARSGSSPCAADGAGCIWDSHRAFALRLDRSRCSRGRSGKSHSGQAVMQRDAQREARHACAAGNSGKARSVAGSCVRVAHGVVVAAIEYVPWCAFPVSILRGGRTELGASGGCERASRRAPLVASCRTR